MTHAKLTQVCTYYLEWIAKYYSVEPAQSEDDPLHLGHLAYMCQTILREFIPEARTEKAMRWLGWVNCAMVARGFFKLKRIKELCRPDSSQVQYCPYCGEGFLSTMPTWFAHSLDTSDLHNTAELQEHQCRKCNNSFWSGVGAGALSKETASDPDVNATGS